MEMTLPELHLEYREAVELHNYLNKVEKVEDNGG